MKSGDARTSRAGYCDLGTTDKHVFHRCYSALATKVVARCASIMFVLHDDRGSPDGHAELTR